MKGVIECREGKKAYCFRYKNTFGFIITLIKCSLKGYDNIINHKQ